MGSMTARDALSNLPDDERCRFGLVDEDFLADHLRTLLGEPPLFSETDPGELKECCKILEAVAWARERAEPGKLPAYAMTRGGNYSVLLDAGSVESYVKDCRRRERAAGIDKAAAARSFAADCAAVARTLGQAYADDGELWSADAAALDCSPLLEIYVKGPARPATPSEAAAFYEVEALDLMLFDPNHCVDETWEELRPDLALKVNNLRDRRRALMHGGGVTCLPQPDYRKILLDRLGDAAGGRIEGAGNFADVVCEAVEDPEPVTVVVEYEIGGIEGGGVYEAGCAPEGSKELADIVSLAVEQAEDMAETGCEWVAVRTGRGWFEDITADTGTTVHVAERQVR